MARLKLKLPSVGDSHWYGPGFGEQSDLERIRRHVLAGRPVWWARHGFGARFREIQPHWHVFAGRVVEDPDEPWTFTWKSLCGYQNKRGMISPMPRTTVTTPKVAERCKRCAAELAKIQAP